MACASAFKPCGFLLLILNLLTRGGNNKVDFGSLGGELLALGGKCFAVAR